MNDYSELERLAEACLAEEQKCPNEVLTAAEARAYNLLLSDYEDSANPAAVLALIAENKAMAEFKTHLTELRETRGFESWAAALVEVDRLRAENISLTKTTGVAMFLTLSEELATLRKKLTTVHFVCDRLPDQDGCRFIELENPQGESLGDESGKWEIRPDGLAQLVVEIASPDVKHMAALLECAQGNLKQAMQIIEKG